MPLKKELLTTIPSQPGVYLFKDRHGGVLYIGKATCLKSRVRSYFARGNEDWKVSSLLDEAATVDHIVTHTEHEAAVLEVRLIREHQPKYNVLAKHGQPFVYLLFTYEEIPRLIVVRNKTMKGDYFGPLLFKQQARQVHRYLLQTFQLNLCNKKIPHGCLDYHLGTCPGTCRDDFDRQAYEFRLGLARAALKDDQASFMQSLKEEMRRCSKDLAYEHAKRLRDYLHNVEGIFGALRAKMTRDEYATQACAATMAPPLSAGDELERARQLQEMLGTNDLVRTIDCFDVSHIQGRYIVGSCVRFADGKPDTNGFRRFRVKKQEGQDDYAALREIVERRYRDDASLPDLVLIDGGKGQRNAVKDLCVSLSSSSTSSGFHPKKLKAKTGGTTPCVALAKREERLFGEKFPDGQLLEVGREPGTTLIRLRDYAHHFAIRYHRFLRTRDLA